MISAFNIALRPVGGCLSSEAEAVVAALRRSGFIDERGYLVEDPRRSNWRDTVREAVRSPRGYVSDESRRRRGRDVDIPRRRVDAAAATWIFRGDESTPRPRRGYSAETSRRAATRIFRGDRRALGARRGHARRGRVTRLGDHERRFCSARVHGRTPRGVAGLARGLRRSEAARRRRGAPAAVIKSLCVVNQRPRDGV